VSKIKKEFKKIQKKIQKNSKQPKNDTWRWFNTVWSKLTVRTKLRQRKTWGPKWNFMTN